MTEYDPASVAERRGQAADEALREFEPDTDGTADATLTDPMLFADGSATLEELQWIVWADAVLESAWAGTEVAASWLAAVRVPTR